jgi:hypothetical protein
MQTHCLCRTPVDFLYYILHNKLERLALKQMIYALLQYLRVKLKLEFVPNWFGQLLSLAHIIL